METKPEQKQIVKAPLNLKNDSLILPDIESMWRAAELVSKSGLVPKHFSLPQQILTVWMAGAEIGLSRWQSLQNMHVVNGKVGISGACMLGLIMSSGKGQKIKTYFEGKPYDDDFTAIIESERGGAFNKTSFSVGMAKKAGIWGRNTWASYPDDMLLWKAVARHARLYYSDVICGMNMVEELRDYVDTEAVEPEQPKSVALFSNSIDDSAAREAELAEVDSFSQPVTEEPRVDEAPAEPKECRYICKTCDREFDTPKGKTKNLCAFCLSADIIDRQSEKF